MLDNVLATIDSRRKQSLDLLKEFLSIPSVSTKPDHAAHMLKCAQWLATQLKKSGLSAGIEKTKGHPVVLGHNQHKKGRPTVLFYGHYDVQPPEPLDLWNSPPFKPTVRKTAAKTDAVYARGAVDDKGQVWAHVEAVRAWQQGGGLPVNLIMVIEGEEEVGSKNLEAFLKSHKRQLEADVALISDTGQFARGTPAITYGLRGLVYMEVHITGPSHDLHSGMYGGSVPNPANVLCELLATFHNADGTVNIPGFYDDVTPLTDAEREQWKRLKFSEDAVKKELKLSALDGEEGYSSLERRWARPTCDINGLTSGYQGPGAKTIIPSTASAKVSMRLVPSQDPAKIEREFRDTLAKRCPKNVTLRIERHGGAGAAVLVPLDSPAMAAASRAVQTGFGKPPVFIREGGSIPIVSTFKSLLNLDTLLVGFGLPDDRVHSPNEKMDLDALHNGTRTAAALYHELAGLQR